MTKTTAEVKAELVATLKANIKDAKALAKKDGYVAVTKDATLFLGVERDQYRLMSIRAAHVFSKSMTAALDATRWNDKPECAGIQLTVFHCREAARRAIETSQNLLAILGE